MSQFPCADKISGCDCQDSPIRNVSAEAPDQPVFLSRQFAQITPPLFDTFDATSCMGICEVFTSQADADLCAQQAALECIFDGLAVTGLGPALAVPPVLPIRGGGTPKIFRNSKQTATVNCPDGNPFSYTVKAGLFSDLSQAAADAKAQSYAQQQATEHQVCLSNLVPSQVCVNTPFSGSITASGNFVSYLGQPDFWEVVDGQVPSGMTLQEGDILGGVVTFTGTPTTAGNYSFTVQVTDPLGDFMVKTYFFRVAGISNGDDFADGTVGTVYNQDVNSAGVTNPIFSLESGTLPDGLQLDSGGIIFGTPTKNGDFDFTLGVTEAGTGLTCNADCTITVAGLDFSRLIWDPSTIVNFGGGAAVSGTWSKNKFSVTCQGVDGAPHGTNQSADSSGFVNAPLLYTGDLVHCNLHVELTYLANAGDTNGLFEIEQDGVAIISLDFATLPGPGSYDFPFDIQAGTNSVITIGNASAITTSDITGGIIFSGTLTPSSQ